MNNLNMRRILKKPTLRMEDGGVQIPQGPGMDRAGMLERNPGVAANYSASPSPGALTAPTPSAAPATPTYSMAATTTPEMLAAAGSALKSNIAGFESQTANLQKMNGTAPVAAPVVDPTAAAASAQHLKDQKMSMAMGLLNSHQNLPVTQITQSGAITMADGGQVSPWSLRGMSNAISGALAPTPESIQKQRDLEAYRANSAAAAKAAPQPAAQPAPQTAAPMGNQSVIDGRMKAAGLREGGSVAIDHGHGGKVPGHGKGDKIPAKYEPGEFVVSNDMLKAKPSLRGELQSLRKKVLAKKGMTPAQADAKAVSGTGLRAMTGLDGEYIPDTPNIQPTTAEGQARALLAEKTRMAANTRLAAESQLGALKGATTSAGAAPAPDGSIEFVKPAPFAGPGAKPPVDPGLVPKSTFTAAAAPPVTPPAGDAWQQSQGMSQSSTDRNNARGAARQAAAARVPPAAAAPTTTPFTLDEDRISTAKRNAFQLTNDQLANVRGTPQPSVAPVPGATPAPKTGVNRIPGVQAIRNGADSWKGGINAADSRMNSALLSQTGRTLGGAAATAVGAIEGQGNVGKVLVDPNSTMTDVVAQQGHETNRLLSQTAGGALGWTAGLATAPFTGPFAPLVGGAFAVPGAWVGGQAYDMFERGAKGLTGQDTRTPLERIKTAAEAAPAPSNPNQTEATRKRLGLPLTGDGRQSTGYDPRTKLLTSQEPKTVVGPDGKTYLEGAVTGADFDRATKLYDESRKLRGAGEMGGDIYANARNFAPSMKANPEALAKLNEAYAADGIRVKAEVQDNGNMSFSGSTTPTKMRYTDVNGKPTSDWSKTQQYAEGVAVAKKDRELGDRMERERYMQEAASGNPAYAAPAQRWLAQKALTENQAIERDKTQALREGHQMEYNARVAPTQLAMKKLELFQGLSTKHTDPKTGEVNDNGLADDLSRAGLHDEAEKVRKNITDKQAQAKGRNDITKENAAQTRALFNGMNNYEKDGVIHENKAMDDSSHALALQMFPGFDTYPIAKQQELMPKIRGTLGLARKLGNVERGGFAGDLPNWMSGQKSFAPTLQLRGDDFFKGATREAPFTGTEGLFARTYEKGDTRLKLPGGQGYARIPQMTAEEQAVLDERTGQKF